MTRIVLIHGFNVKDGGAKTIDRLAPYLIEAGYFCDIDEADYGFFNLLAVRFRKHSAIRRIVKALENADVVISHSNGGNYENKALKLLEHHDRKYRVIRISPALNSKARIPDNIETGHVFYTRTDFWVWISAILPWHPWGRQGWKGYTGKDTRIKNWEFTDIVRGHSDWFADENIKIIAGEVIHALESS